MYLEYQFYSKGHSNLKENSAGINKERIQHINLAELKNIFFTHRKIYFYFILFFIVLKVMTNFMKVILPKFKNNEFLINCYE